LVENKNKIPTFWVENKKFKNFSKNFVFAFEKIYFFVAWIRDPDWEKIQDPDL